VITVGFAAPTFLFSHGIARNVTIGSQQELFNEDLLATRLERLGLRGVTAVEPHENRSVMISVTSGGVLRVHRGYAYAPDDVLAAIVEFVRPRLRRHRRLALERGILAFPAHAFVPPAKVRRRRPVIRREDRPFLSTLAERHEHLNQRYFQGTLSNLPFRISRKMDRRLGEVLLRGDDGRPVEIAISHQHLLRDGWDEVEQTLLHEMIHQWQAETGKPVDHGAEFRRKAREVGVVPRANRDVGRTRRKYDQGF
jgi:hypothetical protein